MKILLAAFVTLTAASMTAVAAWDRGGTTMDKSLLVAMSVVIVLAVHLIPALSRRKAAWLVWTGCLVCAIYGHLTFLTHASIRAGETRAQQSAIATGTERQIDITREALDQIKSRPVAIVAAELATSKSWRTRSALNVEIAEGKRAEKLRDELGRLSQVSTTAQVTESADPVTVRLSEATGISESAVSVVIGMSFSILLELIGALLWFEALRPDAEAVTITGSNEVNIHLPVTDCVTNAVTAAVTEESAELAPRHAPDTLPGIQAAIKEGKCRGTVASIREFIGCSQARAMELRRELLTASIAGEAA